MRTEIHDCDVWLDTDISGYSRWWAWCSCGWEGPNFEADQHGKAVDAWDDHCERVFMEATGG